MADEREWKLGTYRVEEDYSKQTAEVIEKANEFFKDGKVQEAIDTLISMEKTTRLGGDTKSTQKLAKEVVKMLIDAKDWELLMEQSELLMKKRSQMKQVQSVIVQEAVRSVELAPTKEVKIQLIEKLRSICEGKIHVELEYARLTVQLADIWDKDGKLKEATSLMQGLQVETIGNMDKKEKFDIILQQVEMSLRMEDYTVANIMAKKIPQRTIDKPDTMGHKIRFHTLLIRYFTHFENNYMICKQYNEIYNTVFKPEFKPEEVDGKYSTTEEKLEVLQYVLMFLFLSAYNSVPETIEEEVKAAKALADKQKPEDRKVVDINSNEKLSLLNTLQADKRLEELPEFKEKPERWETLQKRVIEHNIRVIAAYYKRLHLSRLSELIGMPSEETEDFLCQMVSDKLVSAKINRMDGIIDFTQHTNTAQQLNKWADGVNEVLNLMGTTCHLITKEQMVHKGKGKAKA